MKQIIPHFWYDKEAREAVEFYVTLFENSQVDSATILEDTPSGDAESLRFRLDYEPFMAISAGPYFQLNPSLSLMVNCRSAEEVDRLWNRLSEGGTVLMPLGEYPFNSRYGWIQDRYGLSWQLMLAGEDYDGQKFIVNMLFTGEHCGQADDAIEYYTSLFPDFHFMARNHEVGGDHDIGGNFTFNEAFSLVVICDNQEEIDFYWDRLSSVPEAEACGWVKDRFGISWQIVPARLDQMMADGTKEEVMRITEAFLGMKKLDMAALERAKNAITVGALVKKPLDLVWKLWTEPEHVCQWNSASENWYTPFAEQDLRPGGTFTYRMAARDGSAQFDFQGVYDQVRPMEFISYHMEDGRRVWIRFDVKEDGVQVTETFDPEEVNSPELQQQGWQSIMEHFKAYVENFKG